MKPHLYGLNNKNGIKKAVIVFITIEEKQLVFLRNAIWYDVARRALVIVWVENGFLWMGMIVIWKGPVIKGYEIGTILIYQNNKTGDLYNMEKNTYP